jgi:hypothetical protein
MRPTLGVDDPLTYFREKLTNGQLRAHARWDERMRVKAQQLNRVLDTILGENYRDVLDLDTTHAVQLAIDKVLAWQVSLKNDGIDL